MVSGNSTATVTFEFSDSIKPLISTLNLVYGETLNTGSKIRTTSVSLDENLVGGQGSVVARDLNDIQDVNYKFMLRTVTGLYTYESAIVELYPTADNSTDAATTATDTTLAPVLPAPTIVQVDTINRSRSILITWSKLVDASGYVIQVYTETNDLATVKSVSCSIIIMFN